MQARDRNIDQAEKVAAELATLISSHIGGVRDPRRTRWEPSPYALERALAVVQRRATKRKVLLGLTCAVGLVAAGVGVRSMSGAGGETNGLSYRVDPLAPPPTARASQTDAPQAAQFSFSDGTRIDLGAGARGRVADVSHRGARFVLDDGKAHVRVIHRAGAEWFFEAGPYEIEVHGTAFSLEWNANRAWLDLKMESGVVSVSGPVRGGRVLLRAGQSLSVGASQQRADAPVGSGSPVVDQRPSASPPPGAERRAAPPAVPRARPQPAGGAAAGPNWSRELDDDRADAILADAERRGLDRVLRESGSDELSALADAARFRRRNELARQALRAQMRRFPQSSRARDDSFFLGRLAEDSGDGATEGLRYYDRYLGDTPAGTYAAEALGRKMMILVGTRQEGEARRIAFEYLRRFPKGAYVNAARALTRAP